MGLERFRMLLARKLIRWTSTVLAGVFVVLCSIVQAQQCPLAEYRRTDKGWFYALTKVEGADQATFHVLIGPDPYLGYIPCIHDSGYAVDRLHAYWQGKQIPGADPKAFTYLEWDYSRDGNHVYYRTAVLSGADVGTFRYVGQQYFKDAAHVYLRGTMINGADTRMFALLNKPDFPGWTLAQDASHVFFEATVVAGANPSD